MRARPLHGVGSGVSEIALAFKGNAFRFVYALQLADEIRVLHAFRKKSMKGIRTTKQIDRIRERLKRVKEMLNELEKDPEAVSGSGKCVPGPRVACRGESPGAFCQKRGLKCRFVGVRLSGLISAFLVLPFVCSGDGGGCLRRFFERDDELIRSRTSGEKAPQPEWQQTGMGDNLKNFAK
jgi:hypothetical protein